MKDETFDKADDLQNNIHAATSGDGRAPGEKKPALPDDRKTKAEATASSKTEKHSLQDSIKELGRFSSFDQVMARLDAIRSRLITYDGSDDVISAIGNLVKQADKAVEEGRGFSAWRLSKEAERLELSLVSDEQLLARAYSLQYDTPKRLDPQLSNQVIEILGNTDEIRKNAEDATDTTWKHRIIEAVRIRDKLVDDLYAVKARVRVRLRVLSWVLIGLLASFVYILWASPALVRELYNIVGPGNEPTDPKIYLLAAAICLGGIGACLSAMMSFTYFKRAPDEFETLLVTFARPLIGATSGLIAIFLAHAGLVTFGNEVAGIGALAFLFGFSERLVIGTVQRFEDRQKSDGDDG